MIQAGIYENEHVIAFVGGLVDLFHEISSDSSRAETPAGYANSRRKEIQHIDQSLIMEITGRSKVVKWVHLIDYFIELPNLSSKDVSMFNSTMGTDFTLGSLQARPSEVSPSVDAGAATGFASGCVGSVGSSAAGISFSAVSVTGAWSDAAVVSAAGDSERDAVAGASFAASCNDADADAKGLGASVTRSGAS